MISLDTPDAMHIADRKTLLYALGVEHLSLPGKPDQDTLDGKPILRINNSQFRYIPHGEIYCDFMYTPEMARLDQIKQLGMVGYSCFAACQDQTRRFHSLATGVMMDLVLWNNEATEHERRLGVVAGLVHDFAMTPYSDQGKFSKPEGYEEEHLLNYVFDHSRRLLKSLKRHRIDLDELIATVKGEGKVGSLLNSQGIDVDNLSYLAIDQDNACADLPFSWFQKIPGLFDQYQNLRSNGSVWHYDNPELLLALIHFRALMYKHIYHNPYNRAKEAFLKRELSEEKVSLTWLLKAYDDKFWRWFKRKRGSLAEAMFFTIGRHYFRLRRKEFDFSLLEKMKAEYEDDHTIVDHLKPPRDALQNLVLDHGKVCPLEEITRFEKLIDRIKTTIRELNYVGVFEQAQGGHGYDYGYTEREINEDWEEDIASFRLYDNLTLRDGGRDIPFPQPPTTGLVSRLETFKKKHS